MAAKTCAACGKEAEGRFCSWCGAALAGTHCTACGSAVEPGARFCNACGAPVGAAGGPSPGSAGAAASSSGGGGSGKAGGRRSGGASGEPGERSRLVWGVAGLFMVALILAVALPAVRQQEERAGGPGPAAGMGGQPAAGAAGGSGAVDLASMTPRERADALFDRIMRTSESGDSAGAAFFIPMGLQAYDMARPLDADGYFHLSLLQRMAGDPESGLATAREALAVHPTHLLNLASAGGAAAQMGDTASAREYYRQYLDAYDEERARGLPEYELHSAIFAELTEEAEAFLEGS